MRDVRNFTVVALNSFLVDCVNKYRAAKEDITRPWVEALFTSSQFCSYKHFCKIFLEITDNFTLCLSIHDKSAK